MMQWKNNKGYTVRETERYIRTYFVDTKYNRIMLIEDKEDHDMDRIKIVRCRFPPIIIGDESSFSHGVFLQGSDSPFKTELSTFTFPSTKYPSA